MPDKKHHTRANRAKTTAVEAPERLGPESVATRPAQNKPLPEGWRWVRLGEAVEVLDNLRKPVNSSEREKRISGKNESMLFPYYGATGQVGWIDDFITNGEFILVGEDGAPFLELTEPKAYKIKGKTWVNNHAHVLRGIDKISLNDFILHYLNSINYRDFVNGTTRLKLTKGALIEIPLPLPSINLQHAIVSKIEELFSELDKGKHQLETTLQQLKVYRQAVLKWAFEGRLTNENVKEGELPEGWRWKTLIEVCDMKAGLFVRASEISEEFQDGLFPCYGGNGLRGYVKSSTHEGMFPLIGRQGALCGNVHLVSGKFHATEHAVVVTRKEGIEIEWLFHKLISMRLSQYSTGTAQPGLSVNKLLPVELSIPPIKEQHLIVQEIESRLSVCDKLEETINQNLAQAETLRQSILKKAFEGSLT
jgi:type I restriction enzyme S subunit